MDKRTIGAVLNKYRTDKGPWRHGYHQCYGEVFKDKIPKKLLEIGVFQGRSLAAWCELFPDTEIHGIDTFKRKEEMLFTPERAKLIVGDSTDKKFTATITDTYDVIIDDGDHRPDAQWQTFLNFVDKWTDCYVIEDVCNEDMELLMRKRLKSHNFNNVTTYRSAFRGNVQINGEIVYSSFFAMVVRRG